MPLVRVEILKGKNTEYKQGILDGVHQALMDELQVPANKRNQRLYEHEAENFQFPADKSDQYTFIEISLMEGRTAETKSRLLQRIVDKLVEFPGLRKEDITIALYELPRQNWWINGGKPV